MPSVKRRPLGARRHRAERYLVITIAAFAVTVAGVRWYLDLAGYPTIGSGDLHVAHVLWGGLALFLAAMLPLLWVGRRVLKLSALLAGVGVGLFIDEVGKFLTTSNDYFFAPAAPIIYGGILLLVLCWLLVRRRGDNMLDATQAVIEALRSGIDGSLTGQDRTRVIEGKKPLGRLIKTIPSQSRCWSRSTRRRWMTDSALKGGSHAAMLVGRLSGSYPRG